MEETTAPRFGSRSILVALGVAFVVAAIWAATALASGGSSGQSWPNATPPGGGGTPSGFVESSDGYGAGAAPSREDCPGHDGGSGGDSAPSDGSSSSGNAL